jgi:tetratricopeptide (TPR) repeat protein
MVAPTTLLADYSVDAWPIARSPLEPRALVALAGIALAAGLALALRRRAPRVALALGWFGVTLLPVSQILPFHELGAEHYLYLPSIGFCLLVALGFERLRARAATLAWTGLAIVLVAFGARTAVRNLDWRDAMTLNRTIVATAPRCSRAHVNIGFALWEAGDQAGGLAELRAGIEDNPDNVFALVTLARWLRRQKHDEEAMRAYEDAVAAARKLAVSPVPTGDILFEMGRYVESIHEYETYMKHENVLRVHAIWGIGRAYDALHDLRAALRYYDSYLRYAPRNESVLSRAAAIATELRDFDKAREYSARAAELRARMQHGKPGKP